MGPNRKGTRAPCPTQPPRTRAPHPTQPPRTRAHALPPSGAQNRECRRRSRAHSVSPLLPAPPAGARSPQPTTRARTRLRRQPLARTGIAVAAVHFRPVVPAFVRAPSPCSWQTPRADRCCGLCPRCAGVGPRCWWTHVPESVAKAASKVPLVIDMHGGGGCVSPDANGFKARTHLHARAHHTPHTLAHGGGVACARATGACLSTTANMKQRHPPPPPHARLRAPPSSTDGRWAPAARSLGHGGQRCPGERLHHCLATGVGEKLGTSLPHPCRFIHASRDLVLRWVRTALHRDTYSETASARV